MPPIRMIVIGAGSRGRGYGRYALAYPEQAVVVGVAEPRDHYREEMAQAHDIPPANVVADWRRLAERKIADAVLITTPDALHAEPAIAFAHLGYDVLLEKPMAPTAADCRRIADAARANDTIFAVCHVMRYTRYTRKLKAVVDSGLIGEIVAVQHLEPVGFWHQAHSFVRGNWRSEAESSFMLLAKSCHDIDWLRHIIGRRCLQVSSFGSLMHFRAEGKPAGAGAAARCLACAYEPECPYSAPRIYLAVLERGGGWPADVLTPDVTREGVLSALATGPYGRCVYECDNDVVDHQVVNLLYEGGATASFTMTAFCEASDRHTRIFGTRGELRGNGEQILHYEFLTDTTKEIEIAAASELLSGHGGGDHGLMESFVAAVATRDRSRILSGAAESLETHLTVFAAERSRLEGQVVAV